MGKSKETYSELGEMFKSMGETQDTLNSIKVEIQNNELEKLTYKINVLESQLKTVTTIKESLFNKNQDLGIENLALKMELKDLKAIGLCGHDKYLGNLPLTFEL